MYSAHDASVDNTEAKLVPQAFSQDSSAASPGFTSQTPQNGAQAAQPGPAWVEYGPAEQALFDAMRPELRLLAKDVARLELELDAAVAEVVDAAFPKALAHLRSLNHLRVFSDEKLEAKLRGWAEHWCQEASERRRVRQEARARGAADRLAYIDRKYGGAAGRSLGQRHSLRNRQRDARDNIRRGATLRRCGWSQVRIASALNIDERTVRRHLVAHAARVMRARILGQSFFYLNRTFGKDESVPPKNQAIEQEPEQPLPNVRSVSEAPEVAKPPPDPPPDEPDEAEVARAKAYVAAAFAGEDGQADRSKPRYVVNAFGQRVRLAGVSP